MTFKCPEKYRVQLPGYPAGDERNGCFIVPLKHQQKHQFDDLTIFGCCV
mgnify:CR=1 FL=1